MTPTVAVTIQEFAGEIGVLGRSRTDQTHLSSTEHVQISHVRCTFTGVTRDGKVSSANAVSQSPAVAMAPVNSPGNATVRQAGGAASVTKVQKTVIKLSKRLCRDFFKKKIKKKIK